MPPLFHEIINSRLFRFVVGETADGSPTEFSVYEEAIAQLSHPLYAITKGGLIEAHAGGTTWPDVGKETFERLVQFSYTGDYSIPDPRELDKVAEPQSGVTETLDIEKLEEEDDAPEMLLFPSVTNKKGTKGKKKAKETELLPDDRPAPELKPDFRSLQCPLLWPRNIHRRACKPSAFKPDRSYANVFLSHAYLYTLAEFWLIYALKALAIYKLHEILCIFEINDRNVTDIIDLIRYVYGHESDDTEGKTSQIRSIVCQYLALHAPVLSQHDGFMEVIGEGGQFAKDFVTFSVRRMD